MKKPIYPNATCQQNAQSPFKIIRYGFFIVQCGRRRYRCQGCGKTFSRRSGSTYFRLRCSATVFDRVAHMSVEGLSRSAISRIESISWQTADRWLGRACESAQTFNDQRLRDIPLVELQADELKTFSPAKKHSTWVFTTIEVCSQIWLSTTIGRRNFRTTYQIVNDTLARTSIESVPLITTDGFSFYKPVIRGLFGAACVYA